MTTTVEEGINTNPFVGDNQQVPNWEDKELTHDDMEEEHEELREDKTIYGDQGEILLVCRLLDVVVTKVSSSVSFLKSLEMKANRKKFT